MQPISVPAQYPAATGATAAEANPLTAKLGPELQKMQSMVGPELAKMESMVQPEIEKVRGKLPPSLAKLPVWVWLVAIAVIAYGIYSQMHKPPATQPGQQPTQPTQPGQQPTGPGGQGTGGGNSALVQEQVFNGTVAGVNGYLVMENGQWTNNSNVIIASATLECVQYSANGQALTQTQSTINGPLSPSMTSYVPSFQVAQIYQGATSAKCSIVAVTQATP
jgi:hypothetical protein